MTLHWWMHWFWVTAQFAVILGVPLPSTTEQPRNIQDSSFAWRTVTVRMTASPPEKYPITQTAPSSMRLAKAINTYQPSMKRNSVRFNGPPMFRVSANASKNSKTHQQTIQLAADSRLTSPAILQPNGHFFNEQSRLQNNERQEEDEEEDFRTGAQIFHRKDTKITWIVTTEKPMVKRRDPDNEENVENFSSVDEEKDLTVLPLSLEERFKWIFNRSRIITTGEADTDTFSTRTFNGSEDIEIDQEFTEPRASSATAVPILSADLSESTRLSRAGNALTSDYHREQAQDRSFQEDNDDVIDNNLIGGIGPESGGPTALDIAAITGSCLAMVVLLSTIASLGFVMYRRKYLNPPQTLNSDKCSNPDSSGYIDDSTIRDNSEEMYSLDNDSFLNSLEAMTIQNYWTDSVKHTKL